MYDSMCNCEGGNGCTRNIPTQGWVNRGASAEESYPHLKKKKKKKEEEEEEEVEEEDRRKQTRHTH